MFTQPVIGEDGELAAILAGSIDLENENFIGRILQLTIGHRGHLMLFDEEDEMVNEDSFQNSLMHTLLSIVDHW